jgi:hypothetical protein
MSDFSYARCAECGKKLHNTFFCLECGQPSCCLDCYCRHEASHAGMRQAASNRSQGRASARRRERAR